jgi:magnesium transporter
MADAVGTQTEVLAVRGLAVGVAVRDILLKELVTGLLIGVCVSLVFFPFCLVLYRDVSLAVAVSIALLVSSTIASVVALMLPWILTARGKDPAFGSGPISTVIQDLLSIAIYLVLATLIV